MAIKKRSSRHTFAQSAEILEYRTLLATALYQGQVNLDYTGPDAGVGPDGTKDMQFYLQGLNTTSGRTITSIIVNGPTGYNWEALRTFNGYATAEYFDAGSNTGYLYLNPTIRNSSGTLVSLPSPSPSYSFSFKINYSDGSSDTPTATVNSLSSPPQLMPAVSTPANINTTTISVDASPGQDGTHTLEPERGEVHLVVTGLAGKTTTGAQWTLSDQVGLMWNSKPAGNLVNPDYPLKVTMRSDNNTADIYFRPYRDESVSLVSNPSGNTMILRVKFPGDATEYVSEFKGGEWDPRMVVGEPDSNERTVSTEAELRSALSLSTNYGVIRLAGGQITITQPLLISKSVKIIGNGTTLYFSQGNTPDWPASADGAIYFEKNKFNNIYQPDASGSYKSYTFIKLSMENLTIKFDPDNALRWDVPNGTANFDPEYNFDVGDTRAVISFNQDRTNREILDLNNVKIYGPPRFTEVPENAPNGTDTSDYGKGYEFYRYVGSPSIHLIYAIRGADTMGSITNCVFQGGSVKLKGGPWTVTDNVHLGALEKTFTYDAFSINDGHDIIFERNVAKQEVQSGTMFRVMSVAGSSHNAIYRNNRVENGVGFIGDEVGNDKQTTIHDASHVWPGRNNPEIFSFESNYALFEGKPAALSLDGRILVLPSLRVGIDTSIDRSTGPGLIVSILASDGDPSLVGKWFRVAQQISHSSSETKLLMIDALPAFPSGGYIITVTSGFVEDKIYSNTFDLSQKTSMGLILGGANFGTEVTNNTIIGGGNHFWPGTGSGIWLVPSLFSLDNKNNDAYLPPEGWTRIPNFDIRIEGNTFKNALNSIYVRNNSQKNHRNPSRRVYITASILDNSFVWDSSFAATNQYVGDAFPTITVGSDYNSGDPNVATPKGSQAPDPWFVNGTKGYVDPKTVRLSVLGNRAYHDTNGRLDEVAQPVGQVYTGEVNGVVYNDNISWPPSDPHKVYNLRNLDIYGTPPTGQPQTFSLIDNSSTVAGEYTATGSWSSFTGSGLLSNHSTASVVGPTATPTATATWTFSNLVPGRYRIAATWVQANNRAADAPFTVKDRSYAARTIRMNQRQTSSPSYYDSNSIPWWILGGESNTFDITGNQIVVQLGNNASIYPGDSVSFVVADGVKVERIGDLLTIDDDETGTAAGFSKTGPWNYDKNLNVSQYYLGDVSGTPVVGPTASPTATATWTFSNLTPGRYRVWASWLPFNNRASDSPFTIKDGNFTLKTIRVDQSNSSSAPPPDLYDKDNLPWWSLGGINSTFDFAQGQVSVQLANNASGVGTRLVTADGIRLERIGDLPTVDDSATGGNGYSSTGTWTSFSTTAQQSFAGDHSTASVVGPAAAPTATATWTFGNLTPGRYRILATWVPAGNRAADSPFTVKDSSFTLRTVRMNQRSDSPVLADYYDADTRPWWSLGGANNTFDVTTDQVVVQLANNATAGTGTTYVVADGVRLQRVGDLQLIDNVDGNGDGYSQTTGWQYWDVSGYGTPHDHATANGVGASASATATATWTFENLIPGRYRIWGTWVQNDTRAPDAPFTIVDNDFTTRTIRVDQRGGLAPPPDRYDTTGSPWWALGGLDNTFDITSNRAIVKLGNNASATVVADALRLERIGDLLLVDDQGPPADSYSTTGPWTPYVGYGGYQNDHTVAAGVGTSTTPTAIATWSFGNLVPGRYRVWTTWVQDGNRATNAPYTVKDGTIAVRTTRINQKSGIAPDRYDTTGRPWWALGGLNNTFDITQTQASVELANNADGYVVADAVRLERIGDLPIVDDASSATNGYSYVGTWTASTSGYLGDSRTAPGVTGAATASAAWTFAVAPGQYRVWVTWVSATDRATNAPYAIFDGTTSLGTVAVDQKVSPGGAGISIAYGGVYWRLLTGVYAIAGDQLIVKLGNNANGVVSADAVKIEKVSPLQLAQEHPSTRTNSESLTQDDLVTIVGAALDRWRIAGVDPSTLDRLRTVRYLIEDLPTGYLALASASSNTIWIDSDASGRGWFVDPTPNEDEEFGLSSVAPTGVDLLTVIAHELGHLQGLEDLDPEAHADDLMSEVLGTGKRRLPIVIDSSADPGAISLGRSQLAMPAKPDSLQSTGSHPVTPASARAPRPFARSGAAFRRAALPQRRGLEVRQVHPFTSATTLRNKWQPAKRLNG